MGTDTSLVRTWLEPYGPDMPGTERRAEFAHVLVRGPNTSGKRAVLHRSPTGTMSPFPGRAPERAFLDEHLVAGPEEMDPPWLSVADVIVRRAVRSEPAQWSLSSLYARFPGCLVAALISDGQVCVVETVAGGRVRLLPLWTDVCTDGDASTYASLIHAWLAAGWSLALLGGAHLLVSTARGARRGVRVNVDDPGQGRELPGSVRRATA
jgi:hypothetical protein